MVMASVKCPECGFDIEIELAKCKSTIIKKCPECGKEICGPSGECIIACSCPEKNG